MTRAAALFVDGAGIYRDLVQDVWPIYRDARRYTGDLPVIAHPPCERWGWHARQFGRDRVGQDGGCFASALESVHRCGGIIEHPASSFAWTTFRLQRPGGWGWTDGGVTPAGARIWTCAVDQGHYGHPAPKRTWLYLVTRSWTGSPPPELCWHRSNVTGRVHTIATKRQREATPEPFARLLIALATGDLGAGSDLTRRDLIDRDRTAVDRDPARLNLFSDHPGQVTPACHVCGSPLPAGSHSARRYCSPRCRQRSSRQIRVVTRARFVPDVIA